MSSSFNFHYRKILTTALVVVVLSVPALVALRQKSPHVAPTENELQRSTAPRDAATFPAKLGSEDKVKLEQLTARLPLAFEVNRGQTDSRVKFFSRQSGSDLFLTSDKAVLRLRNSQYPFTFQFQGANPSATVKGQDQLPGYRNYLLGNDPSKWQTGVPTFGKVGYEGIYPGIDLTYHGNRQDLEYDFELAPGADPRQIRLAFNSHVRPHISPDGDLVLQSGSTELIERKPVVYQDISGERHTIEGHYVLRNREAGFEVGEYDRTQPLVIDPTLVYSTYLGGGGDDLGSSIAIDSNNNVYVAGTTASMNFPTQTPAFASNTGLSDIFVTKINAAGSAIIYSTYIGGSGLDRGDGIAIDSSGNAYVVGRVGDTSTNFPTTAGAVATTYRGGDFDGVLFKLNALGNALVYSTFIGGEDNDSTEGVAVDLSGNAYVTGGTRSYGFPLTATAFQSFRTGDTDAYLTKLNATGGAVLYSTLLGGGSTDRGSGVVVDSTGNAYVAGFSGSPDFPTQNAIQGFSGGSFDAFIARIDTNASGAASLVFSTYLGGIGDDKGYSIAIDSGANNLYVTGQTSSNNFPLLNPAQPAFGGSFDAFIAKITSSGTKVYATYLGGSGDDRATGIAVNSSGEAYVTGYTSSTNFPTVSPLQIANGGGFDAFVAKLNSAGSAFLYSTYLGGSANESNTSTVTSTNPIALDSSSNAYITGYTASTNFPTASPLQAAKGAGQDAFVAKITDTSLAQKYTISGQLTDGFGNAISGWTVRLSGTQTGTATTDNLGNYSFSNLQAGGNYTLGPSSGGPNTLVFSVDVNNLSSDVVVNLQVLFFVTFQVWIRDASGTGIPSVGVRINNDPFVFAQTNSFGMVNIGVNIPITNNGPPATLTPEKSGYVFTPPSLTLSTQNGNQVVNFTGAVSTSPLIQFSSATYTVGEGDQRVNIALARSGDTTSSASVSFATNDAAGLQNCNVINGIASPRCDYIYTLGTLQFAAGETSKSFSIAIVDDSYAEGNETFTVGLNSPSGATLGTQSTATVTITDNETTNGPNPIDNTNFFVRQQYIDFLNREPDPPGFAGWVSTINNCSGDTMQCDRIHVSQLFFQSAEFQSRGYFVYRFYPVAFGRKPDYAEFVPDLARVSGFLDNNQLEAAKVAFIADFMARAAFVSTYNSLTNQQYVDALLNTAGAMLSSRQTMIDGLNNSTLTRAQVLRQIVESTEVSTRYNHQAYAVMEYFGYLRRQPDAFYLDWIAVLDQTNDPRGMVTGFVNSLEYRQRFGP